MDSWESPVTVKAIQDTTQIKDVRILQNLLRNEERFVPEVPDYMTNVQTHINAEMRRRVATWLLEIVQEQNSQPDILCVAVNIMDRFLCHHRIPKESFQLLGAVGLLIASKIREPCPIPGKNLIIYSDNSITAQELKDWELLVLYTMQWELSAITPMDYLDHAIPRLGLENAVDLEELRRITETILALASTDYQFAYHPSSLMAASAIMTALQSLSNNPAEVIKVIKPRVQAATHTSSEQMDKCINALNSVLPEYLKGLSNTMVVPADTTTPDLICNEAISENSSIEDSNQDSQDSIQDPIEDYSPLTPSSIVTPNSRSSSPLPAVDIFTEFNTNVLQPIFDQVETPNSFTSVLIST